MKADIRVCLSDGGVSLTGHVLVHWYSSRFCLSGKGSVYVQRVFLY